MATERHHVVPLSLNGWDHPANIIPIQTENHKKIHKAQNLPYDVLRDFRKNTNHLDSGSQEYKKHYLVVLLRYYAGAAILPKNLVEAQAIGVKDFALYVAKVRGVQIELMENDKAARPLLKLYHYVIELVKVL